VETQIPPIESSALALSTRRVKPQSAFSVGDADCDTLVYVFAGTGSFLFGHHTVALSRGTAALVLGGEEGTLVTKREELASIVVSVGPEADRHAPLGERQIVVRLTEFGSDGATGGRSFQVLFGPHNGSTRATLFAGFVPPGKAPWHYHLYDEIVWVPEGPGRLHIGETTRELRAESAFRLRPREVHIVENVGSNVMTVIGVFTPAGSPSAAYLTRDVAAEYRFAP
jgi:mannose-6-phosphate isomerase-like protein (cupin superfamily)